MNAASRAGELSGWAASLYPASLTEPPLHGAVFAIEQLELHARSLAGRHTLSHRPGKDALLRRLDDSERVIARSQDLLAGAHAAGRRLTPAAEWLFDNHALVEEQIALTRKHFPPSYGRRLPRLASGEHAGMPRIHDLMLEFIAHVDGRVDDEALARYTAAYQSVAHLTLGELWSVAIMLRLALIENLRRVAVRIAWQRAHRDSALAWVRRIDTPEASHGGALLILAEMVRENPPLSTSFVAEFTQALQGRGATTTFVLAWLEQRLSERGQTLEEMVRAESQMQVVDQAAMANSIASLRLVNATEWHRFVEAHSATEAILRGDPAGVYADMDFTTRDTCRHVVEDLARRYDLDEEAVARRAIELATARQAMRPGDISGHVGHLLLAEGKPALVRALRGRAPQPRDARPRRRLPRLVAYLTPITLVAAAGALWLVSSIPSASRPLAVVLGLFAFLAASQFALSVVHWFASLVLRPRALPRMDYEHGIPDSARTMVVVPTLLADPERIAATLEGLELRYLANRDPNLWFGLLTDFCDAPTETVEGDDALLALAATGIEALNARYGHEAHGQFFLFHRPRLHNPREGCFMGRERKRGKLEDFNALLCTGEGGPFSRVVGELGPLASIRFVITLDTDTGLPWGAGWRLVGAAAHPLNRATLDAAGRHVVRGYVILQPRVGVSVQSAGQSLYARLMAGEVGLDPYTRIVSDLSQDLFAETSFIGKGIYDVEAFRRLLQGRFPDNAVLSHDLLESCYARSAQCSDVELLEDSPSGYLGDMSRRHRWMRGDWQIMPWLGAQVSDAAGQRRGPALAALGWWKIFDNLRRALVAPACVGLLGLGWLVVPAPLAFTGLVLALLFGPELLPGLAELAQRPPRMPFGVHATSVLQATLRRLGRAALWLAFLPYEAFVALDAAGLTLWRMLWTRRRMLEWQTAAAVERTSNSGFGHTLRRMWAAPATAVALGAAIAVQGEPRVALAAAPLLLLWIASPFIAFRVSRPLPSEDPDLGDGDRAFLRRVARLTWRYFEVFVGPQENWLPPDNFQERPDHRVAHRTSPTDMGLSLLANLSAYDFGYVSVEQLLDRTHRSLESMEQMERYRGHFYNWYETVTRRPLRPLYVSSVDSGNLVGHIRVLRSGLLELRTDPLLSSAVVEGLRDTLRVLAEHLAPEGREGALDILRRDLATPGETLSARAAWLRTLAEATGALAASIDHARSPEAAWWANALDRQVRGFLADLGELAPWLGHLATWVDGPLPAFVEALDTAPTLVELGKRARRATEGLEGTPMASEPLERLAFAVRVGAQHVANRLLLLDTLARRCSAFTDADFAFLHDTKRKLLAIGYWVADRRLDASSYDLLASEARLASFVAIAAGQIPYDHWFALGRRLTTASGRPVLLSWSGSMFEYLMPLLVMPGYRGTLLDETCRAAVARQIEYGRQRGVPWGISESCYDLVDLDGTYQYRAFGVPGLGLQRGLGEDLVIAPYATILALLVDAPRACANLRRMAEESFVGPYGFYEAADYSTQRARIGGAPVIIPTVMVHHHGMSLLALGQTLLGPRMQTRFLAHPDFRAAALLLQERIPKTSPILHPHVREVQVSHRLSGHGTEPAMRVFSHPNTPMPEVHLLSNGRYHVMLSAAGAGYSRWNELAMTRWREDATAERHGVFCYIQDSETHRGWSNTFQPTLRAGKQYHAIFTAGRAEFTRHDDHIETHTEVAVSAEDDLEIRRITLINQDPRDRRLVITSYAEVVLAPGVTDELHRAFSNLFVESEFVPEFGALLFTRRPRAPEDQPPWMFCMLLDGAESPGPCSHETDRALFVGRVRSARHPAALDDLGPLGGSTGAVLDPCAALRRTVHLPVDGKATLDLVLGAAPTREAALALVAKYQDHRMADRVFEVAPTHSRAVLGHLGATEQQASQYEQLASAVIFPTTACRAPGNILRRNEKGQSGLWAYGISGDLPIVLLRVSHEDHLGLVGDLLRAHAFWRLRGVAADLIIWNEDSSGYRRVLDDRLHALIASGPNAQYTDKGGGVFVRHIDAFPEEDRVLLQSVARLVVRDVDGSLGTQLERWRRAMVSPRVAMLADHRPTNGMATRPPPFAAPRDDLSFANGYGGFTKDGREYIIDLPPGRHTPAPWVNVLANARLGTVVSERGSAYTWYGNAQLYRLTPWNNDAVGDPSGESLSVRDDANGRALHPIPSPDQGATGHTCRHGLGYSVFETAEDGLESRLTTFIAVTAPVKYLVLRVRNRSGRPRTLTIMAAFDLVLGDLKSRQSMHVVTELEPMTGALVARNRYHPDNGGTVFFLDCSESARTVSGDRTEILGRNGDPAHPAAQRLRHLSGRLGPGLDPCAAMQTRVTVPDGTDREVVFVLGAADSMGEAIALVQTHRSVGAANLALGEVWQHWNGLLGVLHAETPDPALDVMVNGWLPHQILSSRMLGRSGFHQSGGAYGFRDQLQDCLALLHQTPHLAREHILRCAERQFIEGDVQHWWHPASGRGVRTACSDDLVWLPYAVARYVEFTGDTGLLDTTLPYLTGRILNEGEESDYNLPGRAEHAGSLYEHCTRALLAAWKPGAHGLPRMGAGDWNDGMNRVGHRGQGESVWLGFFLHHVLTAFAPVARGRGDEAFAVQCVSRAAELALQLEAHAWDGRWYRRAWFDDGEVLGSAENLACRIDSLPQSWATITGVGSPERRRLALDAVLENLLDPTNRLVKLFTPPFRHASPSPGYIQGYPPGVRENGGQYTHAAVWTALAFAKAGRTVEATSLVKWLNPIQHTLDPAAVERYRVEPYVLAADVYSEAPHAGRGGWTWYTGSAAWFYRLIHEVVFGLDRRGNTLRFAPRVPAAWATFTVHYRFGGTLHHLVFTQSAEHEGPARVRLDENDLPDGLLTLVDDGRERTVSITFGSKP